MSDLGLLQLRILIDPVSTRIVLLVTPNDFWRLDIIHRTYLTISYHLPSILTKTPLIDFPSKVFFVPTDKMANPLLPIESDFINIYHRSWVPKLYIFIDGPKILRRVFLWNTAISSRFYLLSEECMRAD